MKEKSGVIVGQKYNCYDETDEREIYPSIVGEKMWLGGFTFNSVFSVFVIVNFLCR